MARRALSVLAAIGMAALLGGALAGCATPASNGPGAPFDGGASPSVTGPASEIDVDATWLDGGRMIGLVTQGSSSCVPVADHVTYANGTLTVVLADAKTDQPCTRDFAPRVTLVPVPAEVDPTRELEIAVTGEGFFGDTDIDGVPGLSSAGMSDYAPSAGWIDDEQFVLLTWGSSSCAPVIESTSITSPTEIAVQFAAFPADQICTLDMGPRAVVGTLASDDGLADTGVSLVLSGAEFDGTTRVAVLGDD